jgi:hypothetical protein
MGRAPGASVADPDPPDPHVFWPLGSGSTSQRYGSGSGSCSGSGSSCKNSTKNLDSYYFVTLIDFLSLKNDVNVDGVDPDPDPPQNVIDPQHCLEQPPPPQGASF